MVRGLICRSVGTGIPAMIKDAIVFLKDQLNAHLTSQSPGESHEDPVVFIDGTNMEPLSFKLGGISVLLINIEEENALRAPDLYSHTSPDGSRRNVQPEIRLNLYVLFVAHYKQYEDSLKYLSRIIRYFQNNRVFDHKSAPALSENIDQVTMELITLPFSEQNEVWNALRVTYHPSVLYKVRMIVYRTDPEPAGPDLEERSYEVSQ